MNSPLVPAYFACTTCRGPVELKGDTLVCDRCGSIGLRRQGVWDFTLQDNYAQTFGRQWATFRHTQIDSKNGTTISRDRFQRITGWTDADLKGQLVLDAGCGAGRFSEIAASMGANLVALDFSEAAYVTRELLGEQATVVRASMLAAPLRPGSFDKVFSIGVLQHTPDPLEAARQLVKLVRPGGEIAIWMYDRKWYTPLMPKATMRRVVPKLPSSSISPLVNALVTAFTPAARAISHIPEPRIREFLRRTLPIASYWGVLPLDAKQQREMSVLDTTDWLTPAYDSPQRFEELQAALHAAGAINVARKDVPGLTVMATRAN